MFRNDFVWGVASSAYQIEGRDPEDGAGKVIWDTFAENGHIQDKKDASVTCDHMHRYKEDYAMMRLLGIKAHRFSVNWARLMPEGTGAINEKAVAMYRDMILEMKKNGIEPYLTLYHWELPQALQDKGGWLNEEIITWFGEYAKAVAENFSDICQYYFTLNEPQCFVGLGYLAGEHAPGLKLSVKESFQVAHNALRAHGQAVINLRKYARQPVKIGYAPTCSMAFPASDSTEDIEAARKVVFSLHMPIENWTWNVAWFSDPVFLGHYPEEGLEKFKEYLPEITKEDMELIAQPLDFMGHNIYNGYAVRSGENGEPEIAERKQGAPKTAANWPVTPECLYWGAKFLYERYKMPLYITENGMSCHDIVSADGQVHDPNRIEFLDRYLSALQSAGDEGADIRGYFLWTFLDNFEWNKGYTERFGIVHVDYETQKRTVKDSAYWYQHVIETNGASLAHKPGEGELLFIDAGRIREGKYKGVTLSELCKKHPELFGNIDMERFAVTAVLETEPNGDLPENQIHMLLDCPDYRVYYLRLTKPFDLTMPESPFLLCSVTKGDGLINGQLIRKEDRFILPCGFGQTKLRGNMEIIISAAGTACISK